MSRLGEKERLLPSREESGGVMPEGDGGEAAMEEEARPGDEINRLGEKGMLPSCGTAEQPCGQEVALGAPCCPCSHPAEEEEASALASPSAPALMSPSAEPPTALDGRMEVRFLEVVRRLAEDDDP